MGSGESLVKLINRGGSSSWTPTVGGTRKQNDTTAIIQSCVLRLTFRGIVDHLRFDISPTTGAGSEWEELSSGNIARIGGCAGKIGCT